MISLALNAFVPNTWDYKVIPSLYEKDIYFPLKRKYDTQEETKAALDYCVEFAEKVCKGTKLRLVNYVTFKELVPFLENPSDETDAAAMKGISPYAKPDADLFADKETFEYSIPEGDLILASVERKNIEGRRLVKPRELTEEQLANKPNDTVSSQPCGAAFNFMRNLETALVAEWEKLNLLLDVAVMNWEAFFSLQECFKNTEYQLSSQSFELYKALAEIVAGNDLQSFAGALETLLRHAVYRRDVACLKALMLIFRGVSAGDREWKVLTKMDCELVEAVKESEYPRELVDERLWEKQPLPQPAEQVTANPYYEKVKSFAGEKLVLPRQGLNDDDAIAIAEGVMRNKNLTAIDLRISPPLLP